MTDEKKPTETETETKEQASEAPQREYLNDEQFKVSFARALKEQAKTIEALSY